MPIHRIHLKGPWEYRWLSPADAVPNDVGRATMPVDWQSLFGETHGRARFTRTFHRPSNLDDDETVWLVFDGVGGNGTASVNDVEVGRLTSSTEAQRFDVTAQLEFFSRLAVELEHHSTGEAGGLYAPVALEIESP